MEERDTHGIQREEGGIDLGRVLRSFFGRHGGGGPWRLS